MFGHPPVILQSDFHLKGRSKKLSITVQITLTNIQNLSLFPLHLYKCVGFETKEPCFDFKLVKNSFLVQIAPDISGTHPDSCLMVSEALAPGLERPGDETDHSHSPSAEVTNEWSYSHTPTMASSCAWRLLYVYNLYVTLFI
jgi:hypothetical protein